MKKNLANIIFSAVLSTGLALSNGYAAQKVTVPRAAESIRGEQNNIPKEILEKRNKNKAPQKKESKDAKQKKQGFFKKISTSNLLTSKEPSLDYGIGIASINNEAITSRYHIDGNGTEFNASLKFDNYHLIKKFNKLAFNASINPTISVVNQSNNGRSVGKITNTGYDADANLGLGLVNLNYSLSLNGYIGAKLVNIQSNEEYGQIVADSSIRGNGIEKGAKLEKILGKETALILSADNFSFNEDANPEINSISQTKYGADLSLACGKLILGYSESRTDLNATNPGKLQAYMLNQLDNKNTVKIGYKNMAVEFSSYNGDFNGWSQSGNCTSLSWTNKKKNTTLKAYAENKKFENYSKQVPNNRIGMNLTYRPGKRAK